jgi:hypothetical protein
VLLATTSTMFQTVALVWAMMLCSSTRVDAVLARFPEACHILQGHRFRRGVQPLGTDNRASIGAGLSWCIVGAQGMLPSLHDCSVGEFGVRVPFTPFPNASRH